MDWLTIVEPLLPTLISVLVMAIVAGLTFAIQYLRNATDGIKQKMLRDALDAALLEAQDVALEAVAATHQRLVADLKAASADGKLTPEQARQALEDAKLRFVRLLSGDSQRVLEAALGPLHTWLEDLLEATVGMTKSDVQRELGAMARPN